MIEQFIERPIEMTEMYALPQGFLAAGIHSGIKADSEKNDLSLFVSERQAVAAGVFTQNRVCGAPVKLSRSRVPSSSVRVVVINSGNSNACTGERGDSDALTMTTKTAESLGCKAEDVLVCSTGVIGQFLPMEKVESALPKLASALSHESSAFLAAAQGMMTTDTFPKLASRRIEIASKTVTISGAAKGAAMIAPNMATMLAVVMTDAALEEDAADEMLRESVNESFNCISVEGHTSTSDSAILMANGAAGVSPNTDADREQFQQALNEICTELAQAIIRDGEGADHFIEILVEGARNNDEARRLAKTVADSPLVKTAITGADPNWGRIVSALGYADVELSEEDISLAINGTEIYKNGAPVPFDAVKLSAQIKTNRDVSIKIQLTHGSANCRFWTCDLTAEYIRLNAEYTT